MNEVKDYQERQNILKQASTNQLSNVNNIILTLATGLIIYLLEKEKIKILINYENEICIESLFYAISILF